MNQPAQLDTAQRQRQFQESVITILASGAAAEFMIASLLFLVGGLALGMTDTEELEWATLVAQPIPTYGASDWHGMLRQERLLALAYRAQYAEASLARLWVAAQLHTFPHALALEHGYFEKHVYAEWNRLRCAAAQDAVTPHLADGGLLSWHAVMDNRTTPECREANGKNFPADKMPVIGWPGAVHPFCLPGDARVTLDGGHARAATVRDFVGDLVTITLASGHELSATPNHPIATPTGWVAVSELQVGAHVLQSTGLEWEPRSVDPNKDHVVPTIEEVAQSLPVALDPMPVAPEDFHGDGANSNVYVVRTNGLLLDDGIAAFLKPPSQRAFSLGDVPERELTREGAGAEASLAQFAPSDRLVSSLSERLALVGSGLRHADVHALAPVPGLDPVSEQDTPYAAPADAEGFCERLLANSPGITAQKIVQVRREPFSGHVYNLETSGGWYIGNSIVSHNCRCSAGKPIPGAPLLPSV